MTRREVLEKLVRDRNRFNEHNSPFETTDEIYNQALAELEKLDLTAEEILKIIDDTLGWNGIGTKFTSQEIDKITHAILSAQRRKRGE